MSELFWSEEMKLETMLMACVILFGISNPAWSQAQNGNGAEAKFFSSVAPGVVKDKRTGLEWMRCSLGQDWSERSKTCTGDVEKFTFEAAQDIAKKINTVGGYAKRTNWRVPTVRELQSLRYCSNGFVSETKDLQDGGGFVQKECAEGYTKPTIAQAVFSNMSSEKFWYWSLSPEAGVASSAWVVDFNFGDVFSSLRVNGNLVRLVR